MWLLADLAESCGQRPSDLAFGDWQRLDFDLSVRALKRWSDDRAHQTTWGKPEDPPKGMSQVPKFSTLADVLGIDEAGSGAMVDAMTDDPEMDEKAAELQRALQRGQIDWSTFGQG